MGNSRQLLGSHLVYALQGCCIFLQLGLELCLHIFESSWIACCCCDSSCSRAQAEIIKRCVRTAQEVKAVLSMHPLKSAYFLWRMFAVKHNPLCLGCGSDK
eukprot:scaffold42154_cov16-Tisochrysis_lutea.AAC.1